MSEQVFQIVRKMNLHNVESLLAIHCSPVIMGIKVSNLFTVDAKDDAKFYAIIRGSGIQYYRVYQSGNKIVFLLFHRKMLEMYLANPEVQKLLTKLGYEDLRLGAVLRKFQIRFSEARSAGEEFPHEIGVLLGYPIEDVIGFMEHKGQDFLYSGYWKVYTEPEEKKAIFKSYENATDHLIQLLHGGKNMKEIMEQYAAR